MTAQNPALSLQPHQLKMVDVFRYEYGSPTLDEKLAQYAPDESLSSRFLVKMEIARLAKPCNRIIDLRDLQSDWKPFEYNGVKHYINDITAQDFINTVKSYKGYTLGAYELIIKRAREKKREAITNPNSISVPEVNYTSLTHFYQRKEQRLYFVSPIEVYVDDPRGMSLSQQKKVAITGSTTDISPLGMCIKLSGIQIPKDTKSIYIRFVGFEKEFSFSSPAFVSYNILSVMSKQTNFYYKIKMTDNQTEEIVHEFHNHLKKFIFVQLRRHRVPIENTQEAVIVKAYEQFIVGKLNSLPVFMQHEHGKWVPNSLYLTGYNEFLLQRLTDENHTSVLNDFICQTPIQDALLTGERFIHYYLFAPVSSPEGFANFMCMPLAVCINDPDARAIAQLAYLKSKGNLMLYRLDGMTIHPDKQCHIPSSLPDSSGEVFQLINQSPVERARLLASAYKRMICISDESDLLAKLDLFSEPAQENIQKNKIFQFIPKHVGIKSELHIVKSEVDDKRQEDRFLYKMPISFFTTKKPKEKLSALTIDISTKGLKIQTEKPLGFFAGDLLSVNFSHLENENGEQIIRQPYIVVNAKGNIVHLLIHGNTQTHEARKSIKKLIQNNLNSLTATGCRDVIYGLPRVIRNLFTFNHPHPVFLVKRHDKNRYISDIALSDNTVTPEISINEDENNAILKVILKHENFIQMLNDAWGKLKERQDIFSFNFLVTVKEKTNQTGHYIIIKNADDLMKNGQMQAAIQQSSMMGETRLLRVMLTPKGKVFNKYFRDELAYLTRYAPNRAKLTLDQINQVDAVGHILDITEAINNLY